MTDKYKNLWKDGGTDPFDGTEPADAAKLDYLHEDMDTVVLGLNAAGKVWVRALQLRHMRPRDKLHLLGQAWFTRHGVSRYAKYRAVDKLEAAGRLRVVRSDQRGPRVEPLTARKRSQNRTARSQNRTGGRSQNRTGA
jgi:hypothetical protein